MGIEGENLTHIQVPHNLEAAAVDETQMATVGGEQCDDGRVVDLSGDPFHLSKL
jgi:hypothetical protein